MLEDVLGHGVMGPGLHCGEVGHALFESVTEVCALEQDHI